MYILVVGILSFASLVYICETELSEEVPLFYKNMTIFIKANSTWTFPECFWWGLMTITTVGYDINPNVSVRKFKLNDHCCLQTFLGKVFGGLCAIVGVFTLTLPIPIVVNSFAGFYKNRLWRNEVAQVRWNTALLLVGCDHVTLMLASDWRRRRG